jgi:hypothetical protein
MGTQQRRRWLRQSYADGSAVGYGYSYGYGTFGDSDVYGCCIGYSYGYGTFGDSDVYGCCIGHSYGHGNGDRDAHAAAYPDAETGSDSDRAYGQLLFV